jgi:hypothetical protein
LKNGGLYQDASIYLKYVKDKNMAICYEKGNMTVDALYKELNQNESRYVASIVRKRDLSIIKKSSE